MPSSNFSDAIQTHFPQINFTHMFRKIFARGQIYVLVKVFSLAPFLENTEDFNLPE